MKSIRQHYSEEGIESLYTSGNYKNPHIESINKLLVDFKSRNDVTNCKLLDLSCGNGEVSKMFMMDNEVVGCDPYTHKYYQEQTNLKCYTYSFYDIAIKSKLTFEDYDYIICSYALHLCPDQALKLVLFNLSLHTDKLVILSPSDAILDKVDGVMNWKLSKQFKQDRSHLFEFILK